MSWLTRNDDESNAITQLEKDSDRAAAIVAAAIVENALTLYLQSNLRTDAKVIERLFHSSAPLGAFSTKIDVIYLLGLIDKDAHRELRIFKDIRNAFAHYLDITTFDSQRIRDMCMSLTYFEKFVVDSKDVKMNTAADALAEFEKLASESPKPNFRIGTTNMADILKKPRDRFLWCARVLNMMFGMRDHLPKLAAR